MTDNRGGPAPLTPHRLRQTLYWLTLDWINLSSLPVPSGKTERKSNVQFYGHPAEWASDEMQTIAGYFHEWHEYLADQRGETPPKPLSQSNNAARKANERRLIVDGWKYLEPRIPELIERVDDDTAFDELFQTHRAIRKRLGLNNPRYTLPIPCPSVDCGLRTLMRVIGVGQDFICCDSCGYTIKETYYPLLVRMTIDTLISAA